jgi:uncharacterized protein YndB with AHSA1/START domain
VISGAELTTATLTTDNDVVLAEIFIAAPPARVFEAITDLKQRAQWWGMKGLFHVTDSHSDLRPGGKWYEVGSTDDGRPFRLDGEYLEIDPPRLLVHTRVANFAENIPTVVRWELEPHDVHGLHASGTHRVGTGTMVRVRHSGFAGHLDHAKSHQTGWGSSLDWLKAFIEKGETFEMRN